MAEFCKECFIENLCASEDEVKRIVVSEDECLCEGCGKIKRYVEYIADEIE